MPYFRGGFLNEILISGLQFLESSLDLQLSGRLNLMKVTKFPEIFHEFISELFLKFPDVPGMIRKLPQMFPELSGKFFGLP